MKYHYYLYHLLVSLSIVVLSCMLITPNTHASAQGTASPANDSCAVQMVHLHGKKHPTITCLRLLVPPGQMIRTAGSDCSSSTLSLRSTDNYNTTLYLCFLGTGFVNLTDYIWRVPLIGGTWDNRVQWYGTGCNTGTFFADINGSGTQQKFSPGVQANFDGQNGRLPEDILSSFQITSSC